MTQHNQDRLGYYLVDSFIIASVVLMVFMYVGERYGIINLPQVYILVPSYLLLLVFMIMLSVSMRSSVSAQNKKNNKEDNNA